MLKIQSTQLKFGIFFLAFVALFTLGFFSANAQEEQKEAADVAPPAQSSTQSADETGEAGEATPTTQPGETDLSAEELSVLNAEAEKLADQDENITPEDLDVGDPLILPGNPLYAVKGLIRGVQSLITTDSVEKAELKIKFANEKLIEAKKLEDGGNSDERVRLAIENYETETQRVKIEIEKLGDSAEKIKIEQIVKKTADAQIKHHKALGKMMKKRADIAPEIETRKAEAMKHLSEGMADIVDPEVMRQKFEEAIREQKGSAFRHFKHVEVLEEVKDFVPEQARGAIQNAIEQSSKFFEEEFGKIEERERKLFNKYIEKVGGNEVRHLEVFDDLTSFADIEKEMFEEMEKAREKARKRVEKRMGSIEDETRKQIFVAHLQDGDLEDARIVKELETNLDPQTITAVLDIKHKMEQNMREKFEQAESTEDLGNFFEEMENFRDVQMLQTLNEMENIIPEDKRDFWQEMKKKAMDEMQREADRARQFGRFEDEMRMMSGFDPEHMAVLDDFEEEFGPQFAFFEDIRKEQAGRIQDRFEHFREFADEAKHFPPSPFPGEGDFPGFIGPPTAFDPADFLAEAEEFRVRIQDDPRAHDRIREFAPDINNQFREFDTQREEVSEGFSEENLDEVIKEAEELVKKLTTKLIQTDDNNPGKKAARELYNKASSSIADITILLDRNKKGEAFGKATSAKRQASNALRKLEQEAFEEERKEYFKERDDFREKFRELPRDERPDPSQFLEFKPTSFPAFEQFPGFKPFPSSEERPERARPTTGVGRDEPTFCAQVITSARHNLTGKCITFPNSCLPPGWERVDKCEEKESFIPDIEKEFRFLEEESFEEKHFEEEAGERALFDVPRIEFFREDEKRIDSRAEEFEELRRELEGSEAVPAPGEIPLRERGEIPATEEPKIIAPEPSAISPEASTFDSGSQFFDSGGGSFDSTFQQ